MPPIDQRNKLDEVPFSYTLGKNQRVAIQYFGKTVTHLGEGDSVKFLKRMEAVTQLQEDVQLKEAQLIMAKFTGNFKRGNER